MKWHIRASKNTIKRLRKPPTGCEVMFANRMFNIGFTSRIHKEFLRFNDNHKLQFQNGQQTGIDISPVKVHTTASKHKHRRTPAPVTTEAQSKPQGRAITCSLGRLLSETQEVSADKEVGRLEPWCTAGENVKCYGCCVKLCGSSSKS